MKFDITARVEVVKKSVAKPLQEVWGGGVISEPQKPNQFVSGNDPGSRRGHVYTCSRDAPLSVYHKIKNSSEMHV